MDELAKRAKQFQKGKEVVHNSTHLFNQALKKAVNSKQHGSK